MSSSIDCATFILVTFVEGYFNICVEKV